MIVLITNAALDGRTGTETFTRDLAHALQQEGHTPIIYTHRIGSIGQEILAKGIPVTDDILTINGRVDVIHGHHSIPTAIAIMRFTDNPAIFVCHDFNAWHDFPPDLPSIRKYVALGRTSASRMTYLAGISSDKIVTIANGVDTDRFRPGLGLPAKPAKALAFCRSLEFAAIVQEACQKRGLILDLVGAAAGLEQCPEQLIPKYDLVFASGRTAQEALVCERAVICCDQRGLAGLMTTESFASWGYNLGLASLRKELSVDNLINEIDKYDPVTCSEFATRTNQTRGMSRCVAKYIKLYKEISAETVEPNQASHQSFCKFFQSYSPHRKDFWPWQLERQELMGDSLEHKRFDLMPPDTYLPFGVGQVGQRYCDLVGFYAAEAEHVWSSSANCVLRFRVARNESICSVKLEIAAILPVGIAVNNVRIRANAISEKTFFFARNGDDLSEYAISTMMSCRVGVEIRSSAAAFIELRMLIGSTAIPQPDQRCIGIMLKGIEIKYTS